MEFSFSFEFQKLYFFSIFYLIKFFVFLKMKQKGKGNLKICTVSFNLNILSVESCHDGSCLDLPLQ